MGKNRNNGSFWAWLLIATSTVGCAHGQRRQYEASKRAVHNAAPPSHTVREVESALGRADLTVSKTTLIAAVLASNPTLESARMAWRAAIAEQPQATSLQDLRFGYALAPLSIRSNDVRFGQSIRLEQAFPWPKKLGLAGDTALANAEVAQAGYEIVRLDLALMASMLFEEYAQVVRLLELNDEHRVLTEDIKAAAVAQYSTGRAPQQEPFQAEVELSHVVHERVLLESKRKVVMAQINQLLHRTPSAPIGLPKREPFVSTKVDASEALQEIALEQRPEIRARHSQIRGRQSEHMLRRREYFPDFSVMGEYNSMWAQKEHRWMVGASLNLPIQIKSRHAAVDQANAALRQAKAERDGMTDAVRSEVEQARQHVLEAEHVLALYQSRLLPAARAQIDAATIGYKTGRNSFHALIDSERSLRTLQVQYEQALTSIGQRRAELDRALGRKPDLTDIGSSK